MVPLSAVWEWKGLRWTLISTLISVAPWEQEKRDLKFRKRLMSVSTLAVVVQCVGGPKACHPHRQRCGALTSSSSAWCSAWLAACACLNGLGNSVKDLSSGHKMNVWLKKISVHDNWPGHLTQLNVVSCSRFEDIKGT